MPKKVLILSASPRRGGNSDTLCDSFAAGAEEAGHSVEKVFLADKAVDYCTGCGACFAPPGTCSQKDDMPALLAAMKEADTIVLGTPIYFYTMAGQLKTFIDRCCAGYTGLADKDFYYIMAAADADREAMRRCLVELDGFTTCLSNAKLQGVVYGTGLWQKGEAKSSPALQEAYAMGRAI